MKTKTNPEPSPQQSPMMTKYKVIKDGLPAGTLLLIRLGDFYEFFFDDAVTASLAARITLTNRRGVPMCGIPYHALDSYTRKLIDLGHRVAVCEDITNLKNITFTSP